MGRPLAVRLATLGYPTTVWNRTPGRAGSALAAGATWAATPAEAVADVEVIITMLADPEALIAVTEADHGLLAGLAASGHRTIIEMSTVGQAAIIRLAALVPAGTDLLDAPVYGTGEAVESGTLRIFVGGAPEVLARHLSLLRDLGEPIHIGPIGSGANAKLVVNAALFGTAALLGEVLALAERLGLTLDAAYEVLATSPLGAQVERRRPSIDLNRYETRFPLAMAVKDLSLITEAGRTSGAEIPVLNVTAGQFRKAVEQGWGDSDYTAVLGSILGRPAPSERP